jgi:mono/diheme cytochrome c family protein
MNTAARWFTAVNAVLIFHAQAWAQKHDVGQTEYLSSCGACHGSDAKGRGPMANQLKVAPADLTQLAKKNGGIFPVNAVYEKIDGRQEVKAHGTREMPIWGYRYMPWPNPSLNPYLDDPSYGLAQLLIHSRILSIIDYLDRVQEK